MGRLRIIATNRALLLLAPALALASCRGGEEGRPAAAATSPSPPSGPSLPVRASNAPVILFLGTSLTAGYGLDPAEAYPARIQEKVEEARLPYRVVNAGVSGETSAGARRRIDWLMQRHQVAVLVVETGANDGLRGVDAGSVRANIQAVFDRARRQTPPPELMLVGMEAPPNYGGQYVRRFRALYPELARLNDAVLIPFLLEGVAGIPELNQADAIHPTAEGHQRVAETVWRYLRPLLATAGSAGSPGPAARGQP